MRLLHLIIVMLLLVGGSARGQFWQTLYPQRVSPWLLNTPPYSSTGLITARVGGRGFEGSGAVARDERLLYSCAHVIFHKGRWADTMAFHRSYHAETPPDDLAAVFARGFHYLAGYTGKKRNGYDFHLDFAVAYTAPGQIFGPALGWYPHAGGTLALPSVTKMILGYPSYFDYNSRWGFYYMHQTGPFSGGFERVRGAYYDIWGVTTGPGNSGGPVLAWYEGDYYLAGILVSGNRFSAGIYSLDQAADAAATKALLDAEERPSWRGETRVAAVTRPALLVDGTRRYTKRSFNFLGLGPFTSDAKLSITMSAPRRGDLDVFLRSPAGRVYVVAAPNPSVTGRDLVLTDQDITGAVITSNPNGNWKLFMRDARRGGGRPQFLGATLAVSSF